MRPKLKEGEKRVAFTCRISPKTKERIRKLKEAGIKTGIGRKIDLIISDICIQHDIY